MWVLTENGELINLDRFSGVDAGVSYVAARNEHKFAVVLCYCDDEEHGKEIVQHIADALANGVEFYNIRNAKFSVYTCGVCGQRFEVPRRGGKVHFLRWSPETIGDDVVCPDCWTEWQDKEAGGAVR